MFSGIVEATGRVLNVLVKPQLLTIQVEKPETFTDLKPGDSVCIDGVCLTVEQWTATTMQFSLAAETLEITRWTAETLQGRNLNLERSLRFGDRIHGHLVTGHVDGLGRVVQASQAGEALILRIQAPASLSRLLWRKGSVAVNGVSLTVNDATDSHFEVCLIPETLKRTNLGALQAGDSLNLETDSMAKAILRSLELKDLGAAQ